MHSTIKTALEQLDQANINGFFQHLSDAVPSEHRNQFNALKKEFISGKHGTDFPDRLRSLANGITPDMPPIAVAAERFFRTQPLTQSELEQADYHHCLRPYFTHTVLHHTYVRPKSLNLVGPEGVGKRRQLDDVRQVALHHRFRACMVDIKGFRLDYEGLMQKIAGDLHLPQTRYTQFEDIVDAIRHQSWCLLLVANLDTLNDYAHNDPRYNARFVSSLNNFKNSDQVQLICTSRAPLNKVVFEHETSILELHPLDMPETLQDRELEAEIVRCACPIAEEHRTHLRRVVRDRPDAYALLTHLLSKVESHYQPDRFETALPKWLQDYGK